MRTLQERLSVNIAITKPLTSLCIDPGELVHFPIDFSVSKVHKRRANTRVAQGANSEISVLVLLCSRHPRKKMCLGDAVIERMSFSDDSKEDEISCASCLNGLENEEFITALGQNYHLDCFR